MAGSVNGMAALITEDYPPALYLHCASHCLNLAAVSLLQVTSVHNMMGVVGRVFQFFAAHPKRWRALEKAIADTQPTSTVHKLKDLCRTRWVQRIDAFISPLLPVWKASVMMVRAYGPQMHLLMPEACCLLSTQLTSPPLWLSLMLVSNISKL